MSVAVRCRVQYGIWNLLGLVDEQRADAHPLPLKGFRIVVLGKRPILMGGAADLQEVIKLAGQAVAAKFGGCVGIQFVDVFKGRAAIDFTKFCTGNLEYSVLACFCIHYQVFRGNGRRGRL